MRKYLIDENLIKNNTIEILGDDFYHLKVVLRQNVNDTIICIGNNNKYICKIKNLLKDKAICEIISIEKNNENFIKISIFQAEIKQDKFELIIQKANELGVTELTPFKSKFSQNYYLENKYERFNKIALESSKQCVRSNPIVINKIISFNEMLEKLKVFDLVIFAYEKSKNSLKDYLKNKNCNSVAIIVGPEGGFSEEEVLILKEKYLDISLGNQILRAETACLFLSSIIKYEYELV